MALKFPSLVGKDAITDAKFLGMGFTGVCFTGALIMIGFGYLGESGAINGAAGLVLGGVGWGYDYRSNWYTLDIWKGC